MVLLSSLLLIDSEASALNLESCHNGNVEDYKESMVGSMMKPGKDRAEQPKERGGNNG